MHEGMHVLMQSMGFWMASRYCGVCLQTDCLPSRPNFMLCISTYMPSCMPSTGRLTSEHLFASMLRVVCSVATKTCLDPGSATAWTVCQQDRSQQRSKHERKWFASQRHACRLPPELSFTLCSKIHRPAGNRPACDRPTCNRPACNRPACVT